MKKKLALLMAAIMAVAMVPATAFASTKLTAVDEIKTAVDDAFTSRVEIKKSNDQVDVTDTYKFVTEVIEGNAVTVDAFDVTLKLTNGKFATNDDVLDNGDEDNYYMTGYSDTAKGIVNVDVKNDTTATITLVPSVFNQNEDAWTAADFHDEFDKAIALPDACVLPIVAKAVAVGYVVGTFTSNVSAFKTASEVIATAVDGDADITIDGVTTFVEDAEDTKEIKDITINELTPDLLVDIPCMITLKLNGNYKFNKDNFSYIIDEQEGKILGNLDVSDDLTKIASINLLNETADNRLGYVDEDKIMLLFNPHTFTPEMLSNITISGIRLTATKDCDAGDVATITVSSDDFDSVKLEAAKMVEEAVTYSVEDKDLPTIWAGKRYSLDDEFEANTLKLSIEENTGDILNTSRKATFTFPEGIEVVGIDADGVRAEGHNLTDFKYQVDENTVTIYNYQKKNTEGNKVDMDIKFILNAAPTYSGDVTVTLGGQFEDKTFTVATVKAPYTVEAKTSEVLIDHRYVPSNDVVITEAEDGILKDGDIICLEVDKMHFEDAGDIKVTEGDIDVELDVYDGADFKNAEGEGFIDTDSSYLVIIVNDESTEASTMVISGLELYLDRTLPVGGYALQNVNPLMKAMEDEIPSINILWENSTLIKDNVDGNGYAYDYVPRENWPSSAFFKYKAVNVNDNYVNVITAARDQDDSMTTKKVVITVGATTMAVGTETVTLDAPAYINSANYTMLPLRAITEAFGATVNWDDTSKTVTILSGQRIISMTIGSKTMYINGTPVAMNTAPEITSARTFIPVRDLASALGISNINWTEASGTVTLN